MPGVKAPLAVAAVALGAVAVLAWPTTSNPTAASAPASQPAPLAQAPAPARATPAPAAAAPAPRAAVTRALFAPWGRGVGELGRARPTEGSPEGPMSFVVDAAGRITVLDQVNERLAIFEGTGARVVPIPARTAQDLARVPGGWALLDRLVRRAIAFVDDAGRLSHEVPLVGPGVPEGGAVTGLFARDDGAWVEVEHRRLVRVADAAGRVDAERPTVTGRFVGPARVEARRRGQAIALRVRLSGQDTRELAVDVGAPIARVSGLDAAPGGRMFLAAVTRPAPSLPDEPTPNDHVVLVVDPSDGRVLARHEVPAQDEPEETFHAVRAGDDGALYALRCTRAGAEIWKVTP